MTKRDQPDPDLVDPASIVPPTPRQWAIRPASGSRSWVRMVTTDEGLTIWRAPERWRDYIGMHLSVLLTAERATCSPVHQPDPPANRS
jgi:hypothetical protein